MRVIAGSARRLLLKTVEGMDTRPTTDRIKETLFNMLHSDLYGCTFLDLFAGSGAIGIEALSRGAKQAVFVENQPKALACIRENLRTTHLEDRSLVLGCDAERAIRELEKKKLVFSYIFMDPPYRRELEKTMLSSLAASSLVNEDTVMIVEAALDTECDYLSGLGLTLLKEKRYKTNKHLFIAKEKSQNEDSHLSGQL